LLVWGLKPPVWDPGARFLVRVAKPPEADDIFEFERKL